MKLEITITPTHYQEGRPDSINEDPLALAIKEKLGDYTVIRDFVSVGETEIFLHYKGSFYLSKFNGPKFYKEKPEQYRIEFTRVPKWTVALE